MASTACCAPTTCRGTSRGWGPVPSTTSCPSRRGPARSNAANADSELERFLHLWAMNRRILMTPFHNMALMSPATTEADVDRHTEVFEAAVVALFELTVGARSAARKPSTRASGLGSSPRTARSSRSSSASRSSGRRCWRTVGASAFTRAIARFAASTIRASSRRAVAGAAGLPCRAARASSAVALVQQRADRLVRFDPGRRRARVAQHPVGQRPVAGRSIVLERQRRALVRQVVERALVHGLADLALDRGLADVLA